MALSVSATAMVAGYELFRALKDIGSRESRSIVESWEIVDALEIIRQDLMGAVAKSYDNGIVFAGDNASFDSADSKFLKFYSLCTADYFDDLCGVRQIYRIEYELAKEGESFCLYRTVSSIAGRNNLSSEKGRKLIHSNIEGGKILFRRGDKLETSFSSKKSLPVYLELKLIADGHSWLLGVAMPCGIAGTEQGL